MIRTRLAKASRINGLPDRLGFIPLRSGLKPGLPSTGLNLPGFRKRVRPDPTLTFTLTDAATITLDASKAGSELVPGHFIVTAAASRALAIPTNMKSWQRFFVHHIASGGTWTLTLTGGAGGYVFGTDIPALTATSTGKQDIIGFLYNPNLNKIEVISYTKGFA